MKIDKQIREHIAKITREKSSESNLIVAATLLAFAAVCFAVLIVFKLGIVKSKGLFVDIALIVTPILFIISSVWCIIRKGKGIAFQFIFLVLLAIFWLELELMSGYKCKLLLPMLIILSLRYYNRKFTIFTYVVCVVVMIASVFCNAYLYDVTGFIDLNLVSFSDSFNEALRISYDESLNGFIHKSIIDLRPSSLMLLKNGILITFLPNMIFLSFIEILTIRFMSYNLANIIKVEELVVKEAKQAIALKDQEKKSQTVTHTLKKYVGFQVADEILSNDRIEDTQKNVTIMFADIQGYSKLCETLSEAEALKILNKCLSVMDACVVEHKGVLDKFIGDCCMAFWNGLCDQEDSELLACQCALDIRKGVKELFADEENSFFGGITVNIGINSGNAIVGNVGSERRMNFSVIGDNVNIAERIQSEAHGGKIYISQSVRDKVDTIYKTDYLGKVLLPGRTQKTEIYELEPNKL